MLNIINLNKICRFFFLYLESKFFLVFILLLCVWTLQFISEVAIVLIFSQAIIVKQGICEFERESVFKLWVPKGNARLRQPGNGNH